MDKETRNIINRIADKVRELYNFPTPIADMNLIVEQMDGIIIETDKLLDYADGLICKASEQESHNFEIIIPESHNECRKNFTIAHELGHLFLDMGYRIDQERWNNQQETVHLRKESNQKEYYANEFAAAFLMPKDDYLQQVIKNTSGDRIDVDSIANYFNVSVNAAINRGRWLGYISWE